VSLSIPITQQLITINEEKDEVEPLRILNPFHGRRNVIMVKRLDKYYKKENQHIAVLRQYAETTCDLKGK
jgi:hypothetical protein